MTRVEKNLLQGESLVYRTRLHWKMYVLGCLLLLLVTVPSLYVVFALDFKFKNILNYLLWILALIPLGILSVNYLVRSASEFVVTNLRVVIYLGVLSTKSFEIMLNKIESIGVVQELWGRIFGYGVLEVGGTGGSKEQFSDIQSPFKFRKAVQEQMRAQGKDVKV
jgi:uncharacterized membrane protein YdbT with pleckstrin-like domain